MKKALLILLALTMIMSMAVIAPIGVAAEELTVGSVAADYKPEGTAVTTAEEFAKMDAAGKYYLAADITISESYEGSFTGVFDGNGHTINTTATLFLNLNGTVKNLTVTGSIVDVAEHSPKYSAVVARTAAYEGNTVIDNVCNKASMKSEFNGMGSMVGRGANGSEFTLTITNSENYGSITTFFAASANNDSGGFVASFNGTRKIAEAHLIIENCANYGTVNAYGRPGGIVGNCDTSAIIKNCTNNGKVQAIDNYCGGIAGRLGNDDNTGAEFVVEGCVNNGPVNYNGAKTAQIGGMVGYVGNAKKITFKDCVNNGDITATPAPGQGANVGGMTGGNKDSKVADTAGTITFENCVNNGNITITNFEGTVYVGGIAARNSNTQFAVYKNCVNNGDITSSAIPGKTAKAAGVVAYVKYDINMANCINNGDIVAGQNAGGLIGDTDSKATKNTILTACGNTGSVTGTNQVGGLIGYAYAGTARGPELKYCFNSGDVTGAKYVAGFIGYTNNAVGGISYSYVGGKMTNTTPATGVATGDAVVRRTEYTFQDGGVDYYFYAPIDGNVTISGNVVTIDALTAGFGAATLVVGGETAVSGSVYKFVNGADTYYFIASKAGAITISGTTAKVADSAQNVTKINSTEVKVFDHRINTMALVWCDRLAMPIDEDTIFIEEDAAGLDYAMGACNTISNLGGTSDSMTKYTAAQFASGEVAYMLNQKIGADIFMQNLMPDIMVVDEYPTTDATHAKVIMSGLGYTNLLFPINPDCTPDTGDATIYVVVALAVSAVALAGLVVFKKRKIRD